MASSTAASVCFCDCAKVLGCRIVATYHEGLLIALGCAAFVLFFYAICR